MVNQMGSVFYHFLLNYVKMRLTLATQQVGQLVGKIHEFRHFRDYCKTIVARRRIIHLSKPISFTVGGGTDENG
jgi:hypothetical protein